MNVKFTPHNALIGQNKGTRIKCLRVVSYWLSVTSLVIFLSFDNFFLILELATLLAFFKHIKTLKIFER